MTYPSSLLQSMYNGCNDQDNGKNEKYQMKVTHLLLFLSLLMLGAVQLNDEAPSPAVPSSIGLKPSLHNMASQLTVLPMAFIASVCVRRCIVSMSALGVILCRLSSIT
jgi:hypothetical protein